MTIEERLKDLSNDFIYRGEYAANLLGIGVFSPNYYEFSTKLEKLPRIKDAKIKHEDYVEQDVTIIDKLPVFNAEKIIVDLFKDNEDRSLIIDCIHKGERDKIIDLDKLVQRFYDEHIEDAHGFGQIIAAIEDIRHGSK
jgi:hypothetical protein